MAFYYTCLLFVNLLNISLMKKEKFLNFLSSKSLMMVCLVFGFVAFSNIDAKAQKSIASQISKMEQLRDSFAPSTAKYSIAQEAVTYLQVLENNVAANPNYINDIQSQSDVSVFQVDQIRRAHPTILAVYSAAELAEFSADLVETNAGASINPQLAQKLQWILDANAY